MMYVHETYVLIEKILLNVLAGMTNPQSYFNEFADSAQHIIFTLYTSIYMRFWECNVCKSKKIMKEKGAKIKKEKKE